MTIPTPQVPHTSLGNFSILGKKSHNLGRTIKEGMYVRVNELSLNRNIGKYWLYEVLFNVPDFQLRQTTIHHQGPITPGPQQ